MMWLVVLSLVTLMFFLYKMNSRHYSHWKNKGIPGPRPLPIIGNMWDVITFKKSLGDLCFELCKKYKDEPLIGIYYFTSPTLVVNRLDLMETVLIKDFAHFTDHRAVSDSIINISDNILFVLTGKKWKTMRTKMSPAFTSSKLRRMTPMMRDCFQVPSDFIDENITRSIEPFEFIDKFILAVTSKSLLGIDVLNPDSHFFKMCHGFFQFSPIRYISNLIYFNYPKLSHLLKISFASTDSTLYFQKIVQEAIQQRRLMNLKKNDFLQLLLELKDKGNISVENLDKEDDYLKITEQIPTTETIEMTDNIISGQALIFLVGGFDTMSTVMAFTMIELVQNQRVMEKLVAEIDGVLNQHKDFTYEALNDMNYLDMCLTEAMRLHPTMPALIRRCTKDYTFQDGTKVDKDTTVLIPTLTVHNDESIYPEPDKFIPERFENPPSSICFLSFGQGPRICIAKRYAMVHMKMLISRLLHTYGVRLHPSTKIPVTKLASSVILIPSTPVYLTFTKRLHSHSK